MGQPFHSGRISGLLRIRPRLERLEDRMAPAIFNVNSLADILNPPVGVVTLRSAIESSNATPGGNTINLTLAGTYQITIPGAGEDNNATGDFDIMPAGGNLTIQNTSGGVAIVDANRLDRAFDINPGNTDDPASKIRVIFAGFTIENGSVTDAVNPDGSNASGGGIRDQGNASLTLTNMVVTNNVASADGGGVSMENAPGSTPWTLTLNNTNISNNHAGDAGGGIDTDGKGRVFINAGSVLGNNSTVNQGAGIWLDSISGAVDSVTITNPGTGYTSPPVVSFISGSGSGASAVATITGGAVTAVTIINSGSGYLTAPAVSFTGGGGTGAAATATVVAFQSATLNMTDTVVSANTAQNGPTGAIGNSGNGAVTIASSTIENNFSGSTGGGFGDSDNLGTLTVTNSLFQANSAVGNGGGIQEGGPSVTISNTEFRGNSSSQSGGGIFTTRNTLSITSSTFAFNTAAVGGGGIELQTTGMGIEESTITNSTIAGNSALNAMGANGGGIDASANFTGTLALVNDTINANFAASGGGLFWAGSPGSTFTLLNTIVAHNNALTGPDANNPAGTFTDNGGNLIGIAGAGSGNTGFVAGTTQTGSTASPLNPQLGPLQNNGGPRAGSAGNLVLLQSLVLQTEGLLPGSPAIGHGIMAGAPVVDERGFTIPAGSAIDVGAFQTTATPGANSANQRYVDSIYLTLLNRTADAGAAGWVNLLNQGTSRAVVVAGIESSPEYRMDLVQAFYQHFLHRQADPGGLQNFVNDLGSGTTEEQVQETIVTSPEYFQLHGSTNTGFVTALYLDVLNRQPDAGGLAHYVSALMNGDSRGAVAAAFFTSSEYLSDLVAADYLTYLGRAEDPTGATGFLLALQSGATDQALVAAILGSAEAFARRT